MQLSTFNFKWSDVLYEKKKEPLREEKTAFQIRP